MVSCLPCYSALLRVTPASPELPPSRWLRTMMYLCCHDVPVGFPRISGDALVTGPRVTTGQVSQVGVVKRAARPVHEDRTRYLATKPDRPPCAAPQRCVTRVTRPGPTPLASAVRSRRHAASLPSATTSTLPSARLVADPARSRSAASRPTQYRNPTPCTLPSTQAVSRTWCPSSSSAVTPGMHSQRTDAEPSFKWETAGFVRNSGFWFSSMGLSHRLPGRSLPPQLRDITVSHHAIALL